MKDTILYKLLKWIVASSVSLFALPISVFAIIFSLYPDLATENNFHYCKLKSYYELCDSSRKDSAFINENSVSLISKRNNKNINKSHLLIIDQTQSTVFKDIELDSLKKYLMRSIDTVKNKIDTTSIKSLIYTKLIESFNLDYNCNSLFVYFYNGSKSHPNTEWIEVNRDAFSPKLLNFLNCSNTIKNQETDFREIFRIVEKKNFQVPNLDCITFLSDFYHEPKKDLSNTDFDNFKKISKNIKINLIALWKTAYTGKDSARRVQRQNNFIARFDENFLGVVSTEKLSLEKYQNSSFTNRSDFYEFEEIITYKPSNFEGRNDNDRFILLYSPITNNLKYNDAQVKIKMDKKNKFHWKIKSTFDSNKAFIKFNRNCDTSNSNKCRLNQWYEEECDSLLLSIKLDNNLNIDDLKFCYVVMDGGINKFEEYKIEVKKIFIHNAVKMSLLKILNLFVIFFIISIVSSEILIALNLFSNESKQ